MSDHKGLTGSWGTDWPVTDTIGYVKETTGMGTFIPKYIGKEVIVENKKDEKYPESSFLVMNTDKLKALGWKAHVGMEDAFDKLIYNYEKE